MLLNDCMVIYIVAWLDPSSHWAAIASSKSTYTANNETPTQSLAT